MTAGVEQHPNSLTAWFLRAKGATLLIRLGNLTWQLLPDSSAFEWQ
jgi:hypothetical protein